MESNRNIARQWIESLTAERGISAGTVSTYGDDIDCYLGFLGNRTISSVTIQDVRAFISYMDERQLAASTSARRRSVARSLHRFAYAEGFSEIDPTAAIERGKRRPRIPHIISMGDVDRLLQTAHERAADISWGIYRQAGYARRAALLETLYASGMRVSEAVNLKAEMLRAGQRFLYVKGKGGKERLVPLHEQAIVAINRWRDLAAVYGTSGSEWLFHQTRSGLRPLTRHAAFLEIREAATEAGLARPDLISPHKLRHAFATHLLSNGANLREIQELLGHADLGSTEIYTHVAIDRIKEMVFDLHPLSDRQEA